MQLIMIAISIHIKGVIMISINEMKTIRILKEQMVSLKSKREALASSLAEVDKELLILSEVLAVIREKHINANDS